MNYDEILTEEFLNQEYLLQKKSMSSIARQLSIPRKQVALALDRLGMGRIKPNYPRLHEHANFRGTGRLPKSLVNNIKTNAKARGLVFNVTMEELWSLFEAQNEKCALTGVLLTLGTFTRGSASLDRIDSSRGYELGNVCWVHKDVNLAKQSLSVSEFIDLCDAVAVYGGVGLHKVRIHHLMRTTRDPS